VRGRGAVVDLQAKRANSHLSCLLGQLDAVPVTRTIIGSNVKVQIYGPFEDFMFV
jgi:hypothetical protein